MRSASAVMQEFSLSPEQGLTSRQVEESRQRQGANRLTPLPREPLWKKFLEKFDEPIIKILLAAALLSMVVDLFRGVTATEEHDTTRYVVGGVLVGLMVLAVAGAYLLRRGAWIPTI